jgi:hypothetical protein
VILFLLIAVLGIVLITLSFGSARDESAEMGEGEGEGEEEDQSRWVGDLQR